MPTFSLLVNILWFVFQAVVLGFMLWRSVAWAMDCREAVLWQRSNARGPTQWGRRLIAGTSSVSVIVLPVGNTGITSSSTHNV